MPRRAMMSTAHVSELRGAGRHIGSIVALQYALGWRAKALLLSLVSMPSRRSTLQSLEAERGVSSSTQAVATNASSISG